MALNSNIEWTHDTANLWHGCTKVHKGCDHCYAETQSKRFRNDIWGDEKSRLIVKSFFSSLTKYQELAIENNEVRRVFVGSMMDIFEKSMPLIDSKGNPCFYEQQGFQGAREYDLTTVGAMSSSGLRVINFQI